MKRLLGALSVCALFGSANAVAQEKPFTLSGYAEVYYNYDFKKPMDHNRPGFMYSHNRNNEFNLNLGYIKGAYNTENVRANLAFMMGTYANANLAAEPSSLKNVYEANVGFRLIPKTNLWVDAGIFSSHIGFESAMGASCMTLSRSMLADNSPYYESGIKVSWQSEDRKWYLVGLVLNGWQRINRPDDYNALSFGHQLTYTPSAKVTLNSSSFIGSDSPDSTKRMRYFHNFYGNFNVTGKFALTAGFDIGWQQKASGSSAYSKWYSPVLIARYQLAEKWAVAVRGEYYSDKDGVIISTAVPKGFNTFGYSTNVDLKITDKVLWRVEYRGLSADDAVFANGVHSIKTNNTISTSLSIAF